MHGYDNPWPAGGGENLFRTTATGKTEAGVTWTVNDDGSITVTGTSTGYTDLVAGNAVVSGIDGYVTIRGFGIGTVGNVVWSGIGVYTSDGVAIGSVTGGSSQETFVVNLADYPNADYIRCILKRSNNVVTNATIKIQVSKGQTAPTAWSPYSNICPISGRTEAEISGTGVNVWDEQWENGWYDVSTGEPGAGTSRIRNKNKLVVIPGTTYYFVKPAGVLVYLFYYDVNENYITWSDPFATTGTGGTFTTPADAYFMSFTVANSAYNNDIAINYPTTDTTYHPYTGNQISVTFPSEAGTVYGGTLTLNPDRTGTLVVNMAETDIGTLDFAPSTPENHIFRSDSLHGIIKPPVDGSALANAISSSFAQKAFVPISVVDNGYFSVAPDNATVPAGRVVFIDHRYSTINDFKAAMSGAQLVYELVTPQTYQLTAEQVSGVLETLYGTNNIWSSTGDTEVEYPCDTKLYIDNKITQAIANALNS